MPAEPNPATAQPGVHALMGGKLGLPRLRSDHDLATLVEARIPVSAIQALIRGGLSDAEAYELIVPRRTLAHRVANQQPLSRDESDRAVRIARIAAMAERAFCNPEKAWRWLRKPKRRFAGKSPLATLASEAGARLVEEMLLQFEYGMAA